MTLGEKLSSLRKKQGWSQEELSEKLDVSRQSVSKWESDLSVPDIDKIVKLSEIYSVSTDYLLKSDTQAKGENESQTKDKVRELSRNEVDRYIDIMKKGSWKIALGVLLCIVSPVPILLLEGSLPEKLAGGIGASALFILIAAAVAMFIIEGFKMEKFIYLEKEPINFSLTDKNEIKKQKEEFEPKWRSSIVIGVILFITSVVPLLLYDASNFKNVSYAAVTMLCFIAVGVFLIVYRSIVIGSYNKLLEEGDYTREKKASRNKNALISSIYWSVILAIYLLWSLLTFNWHFTWIIWPVAAVLYGAIIAVIELVRKKK